MQDFPESCMGSFFLEAITMNQYNTSKVYLEIEQKIINLMLRHSDIIEEMLDSRITPDFFDPRHRPLVQSIYHVHGVSSGKRVLTDDHYRSILIASGGKGDITIPMQVHHECMFGVHISNAKDDFDLLKKQFMESFVHRSGVAALATFNKNAVKLGQLAAMNIYSESLIKITSMAQDAASGFDLACMADVEERQIDWLWDMKFPLGMLSLLGGDGGHGKSFLTLDLAARISQGIPFPDSPHSPNPKGHVLFISSEDLRHEILAPRLRKQGADPTRIHHIRARKDGNSISLQRDIFLLRKELEVREYRLLVIDPLNAYIGADTKANMDNAIRSVLTPIQALAEDFKLAVIGIVHFNKDKNQSAAGRILGSVGYVNAVRMVWNVIPDKDDVKRKLFVGSKQNIVDEQEGLAFRIIADAEEQKKPKKFQIPKLVWEDGTVSITADEAMSADTSLGAAVEWLQEELQGSMKASSRIYKSAVDEGVSKRTLERAKKELGVKSIKMNDGWYWSLPAKTNEPKEEAIQDEKKYEVAL